MFYCILPSQKMKVLTESSVKKHRFHINLTHLRQGWKSLGVCKRANVQPRLALITCTAGLLLSGKGKETERKWTQSSKYCQIVSLKYMVHFGIVWSFWGFYESSRNTCFSVLLHVFLATSRSRAKIFYPVSLSTLSLFQVMIYLYRYHIDPLSYQSFTIKFHKVS